MERLTKTYENGTHGASDNLPCGENKDMYCNGTCKYLNERKHKCELTGEKLSYMKQAGSLSFAVHEHRGTCKGDKENGR